MPVHVILWTATVLKEKHLSVCPTDPWWNTLNITSHLQEGRKEQSIHEAWRQKGRDFNPLPDSWNRRKDDVKAELSAPALQETEPSLCEGRAKRTTWNHLKGWCLAFMFLFSMMQQNYSNSPHSLCLSLTSLWQEDMDFAMINHWRLIPLQVPCV